MLKKVMYGTQSITALLCINILGIVGAWVPSPSVQAQTGDINQSRSTLEFMPPPLTDRGRPRGRRSGGASRGCAMEPEQDEPISYLTALVPASLVPSSASAPDHAEVDADSLNSNNHHTSDLSLTTASHPSFWFYIPYALNEMIALEFVLETSQGDKFYHTKFTSNTDSGGVIQLALPPTASPLTIDESYQWYFSIYCDSSTRTVSDHVNGWIARIPIDSTLQAHLTSSTLHDHASIYAASGIWHDALTTLGERYQEDSQNRTLSVDWVRLLTSVQLDEISGQPLLECCNVQDSRQN